MTGADARLFNQVAFNKDKKMSFGVLNAVLVLLYWAITKNFFPELSGANYYVGLALCVIAAKVFASRKESPASDSIVFNALLPLVGTAMIVGGLWLYSTPEDITPSGSEFAQVSEPFPDEMFTVACVAAGMMILVICVMRLLRK